MHIVFVDSNSVGLNALRAARRAGHEISYVASRSFEGLLGPGITIRDLDVADRIVDITSSNDEDELHATLRAIDAQRAIDGLTTVLDYCALSVARVARRLGLRGTAPEALALAQDKAACRRKLELAGLASTPSRVVSNRDEAATFAAAIGFPLIAKPNRGAASIHAARIACAGDLDDYFESLGRVLSLPKGVLDALSPETLLERYVDGPLFSVEIAAADGARVPLMLSARKRCIDAPAIELGTTMPAPVRAEVGKSLIDYALAVTHVLGLDLGVFHIEVIQSQHGPVLVEANPRIMGGNMPSIFRLATDIDPYDLLNEIHLTGRMPEAARQIVPLRAAATRMIGPRRAGVIGALAADWHKPFQSLIDTWHFDAREGLPVDSMDHSHCPFSFRLTRPSAVEASLFAEWIVSITAQATGLDLRRSSEDFILA